MPKYRVLVERSAVEVIRYEIRAHTIENAERIAQESARNSARVLDKRVISHHTYMCGDEESEWEVNDSEELPDD